ncbi:hypothetical protein SAMN05216388_1003273 [Halorientalis persicus]|uniref:Uncharacterized protein n=1 Tax=Halorientalis persicus TaxID=1367881 RepID=A0A1H8H309_9EURY|nr:hypothetical protein SAMN05216388_1003273 [Halorientalis persicus]
MHSKIRPFGPTAVRADGLRSTSPEVRAHDAEREDIAHVVQNSTAVEAEVTDKPCLPRASGYNPERDRQGR